MSGTLPITDFVKISMSSVIPSQTSVSISGRRQTKQYATQYWQFDCEYRSLQRTQAAQVMAFIAKQRNNLLDFDIELPEFSDTQGTVTAMLASQAVSATLTVGTSASTGATAVTCTSAWTSASFAAAGQSASEGLKAGDFITFSNHTKIYQLTDDVSFNGSGTGVLNIFPALITAVTGSSTTVNYNNVLFRVFLTNSNQTYDFGLGDTSAITLKLQESL